MDQVHAVVKTSDKKKLRPSYEELEVALKNALARLEIMQEYAKRQLAEATQVVNPWTN